MDIEEILVGLEYTPQLKDSNFGKYYEKQEYFVLGYTKISVGKTDRLSKKYDIYCSKCASDPELFGDGIFTGWLNNLNKDSFICGCSKNHHYNDYQRNILTLRKADECGVKFIKILGDSYKGFAKNKLKILCKCSLHGNYETSYDDFMRDRSQGGCLSCANDKVGKIHIYSFNENINSIKETKSFPPEAEFKETYKYRNNSKKPNDRIWEYKCSKCSNDEFVKNGLCSGIFSTTVSCLKQGSLPCRCALSFKWSFNQYEYRINKNNQDYNFVKWDSKSGPSPAKASKFSIHHKTCGNTFKTNTSFWLSSTEGCPFCAGKNADHLYLHVLSDNNKPIAMKLGISNNPLKRLSKMKGTTDLLVNNLIVFRFKECGDCRELETYLKRKYKDKLSYLHKSTLKDGWTETSDILNLPIFMKELMNSDFEEITQIDRNLLKTVKGVCKLQDLEGICL